MLTITLPNQDKKKYNQPVTSMQIAEEISKNLASNAFVSLVNGELWDLERVIEVDQVQRCWRQSDRQLLSSKAPTR